MKLKMEAAGPSETSEKQPAISLSPCELNSVAATTVFKLGTE